MFIIGLSIHYQPLVVKVYGNIRPIIRRWMVRGQPGVVAGRGVNGRYGAPARQLAAGGCFAFPRGRGERNGRSGGPMCTYLPPQHTRVKMRQVKVKDLYATLSRELKDLPFAVVLRGVVVAVVSRPECKSLDKPTNTSRPKGLPVVSAAETYPVFRPMPKGQQAAGKYDR